MIDSRISDFAIQLFSWLSRHSGLGNCSLTATNVRLERRPSRRGPRVHNFCGPGIPPESDQGCAFEDPKTTQLTMNCRLTYQGQTCLIPHFGHCARGASAAMNIFHCVVLRYCQPGIGHGSPAARLCASDRQAERLQPSPWLRRPFRSRRRMANRVISTVSLSRWCENQRHLIAILDSRSGHEFRATAVTQSRRVRSIRFVVQIPSRAGTSTVFASALTNRNARILLVQPTHTVQVSELT